MKPVKLLTGFLVLTSAAIISCNGKSSPKDLIVNKWKITDISGKGVEGMPDSAKTKIYESATMEFMKDGKFVTSDMGNGVKKGTYSIINDGKTLVSTDEGAASSDSLQLVEITKDKMVVNDTKSEVKITFGHK